MTPFITSRKAEAHRYCNACSTSRAQDEVVLRADTTCSTVIALCASCQDELCRVLKAIEKAKAKSKKLVKWVRDPEIKGDPDSRGYWESAGGRFDISPVFRHRTTPDGYTLVDRERPDPKGMFKSWRRQFDTVRDAKVWAEQEVAREVLSRS